MVMCTLFGIYDYEAAVNLLDLIFSIDNKLVYIKVICNTYPPIIRIIAFSGLKGQHQLDKRWSKAITNNN